MHNRCDTEKEKKKENKQMKRIFQLGCHTGNPIIISWDLDKMLDNDVLQ